jgi:hypothetical protein
MIPDSAVCGRVSSYSSASRATRRSRRCGTTRPSPTIRWCDTRTTQIYINLDDDNVRLDAQGFAPLGRVTSGMDVVDQLYAEYDESAGGGMRGGQQGQVAAGGNAYLDAEFPNLDHLIRASIVDGR